MSQTALTPRWQFPAALIVVLAGIMITLMMHPDVASSIRFGPSMPAIVMPTRGEWKKGYVGSGAA